MGNRMGQYIPSTQQSSTWAGLRLSLSKAASVIAHFSVASPTSSLLGRGAVIVLGLLLFAFLVLAFAQAGSGASCHWKFPKWFGCVLSTHENLAGGLIGASGALIAAWIAWTAVQQQINAERERMLADRLEAEQLLADEMIDYADGMAAAWRLLERLSKGEITSDVEATRRFREAIAYMANRLSRPEHIASYRAMAITLGWDRRRKYSALINGLDELKPFSDTDSGWDSEEALNVIRNLSVDFEICLPETSTYFNGLWRRSPKAMTFAMYINWIAGVD
jgi:hypothetical protein